MRKLGFALFALLLAAPSAAAGIVYNWVEISPSVGGQSFQGSIEIANSDWLHHSLSASFEEDYPTYRCTKDGTTSECASLSDIGVLDFSFSTTGPVASYAVEGFGWHAFSLDIGLGPTLSGAIRANTGYQNVILRLGGDDLWYIDDTGDDYTNVSCYDAGQSWTPELCLGVRGQWVLDRRSLPSLPTPPAMLLIAFGLFALLVRASGLWPSLPEK